LSYQMLPSLGDAKWRNELDTRIGEKAYALEQKFRGSMPSGNPNFAKMSSKTSALQLSPNPLATRPDYSKIDMMYLASFTEKADITGSFVRRRCSPIT